MKKLKVISCVGTRPEIIKLSRCFEKFDKYFEHVLVHTGQNFSEELNNVFFSDLKIRKPDYLLDCASKTSTLSISKILMRIEDVILKEKPDCFVVLGDTNSCFSALAAKKNKIPIFHLEAGNRCFDERVPEEVNRRIIDHFSDINIVYSDFAKTNLINEGIIADRIIKLGSPMFEIINHYKKKINQSNILNKLKIKKNKFFLMSLHREENLDNEKNFINLLSCMNKITEKFNLPIIFSTHPRTKKKIENYKLNVKNIHFIKAFNFTDFVKLQLNAKAILTDSGTINEEASILNLPALNLREAYERQEAMEEGTVMLVGNNTNKILQGLEVLKDQSMHNKRLNKVTEDYNVENFSEKLIRVIISYTDYVNKVVWKKS
jgi:UDP-N-acetylglucosamine 2-epimerase (non-hydrolysing)